MKPKKRFKPKRQVLQERKIVRKIPLWNLLTGNLLTGNRMCSKKVNKPSAKNKPTGIEGYPMKIREFDKNQFLCNRSLRETKIEWGCTSWNGYLIGIKIFVGKDKTGG